MGDMKGKTRAEIEAVAGPATSYSAMADGFLLQWMATGYHIALMFDEEGRVIGISHEHAST